MRGLALWCDLLNAINKTRQAANHGCNSIHAHIDTKKPIQFFEKYSLRHLNSSEALVFLAIIKHTICPHEYPLHGDIEQKLATQLCFQYL